jgi:hypothetical protein
MAAFPVTFLPGEQVPWNGHFEAPVGPSIGWRTQMKNLKMLLAATLALSSLSIASACGTLVGAGAGAAVGAAVDDEDRGRGAAVGAAAGAVAGTIIDPP